MTKEKNFEDSRRDKTPGRYTFARLEEMIGKCDNEMAHILAELECDDIVYQNGRAILMSKGKPINVEERSEKDDE